MTGAVVVKPSNADYQQAFQNPRTAFNDPYLQLATPAKDRWGLPKLISGNFAVVCHLHAGEHAWAVRAFSRDVPDLQRRYDMISTYLESQNSKQSSIVGFRYVAEGIRVNGRYHPIVVMDWVPGTQLDVAIQRALHSKQALRQLIDSWTQLIAELDGLKVAHGDLQHGNILGDGTSLRLVDYDGMFVPTMAGMLANEQGHRHYQHPGRASHGFDESTDRFSALLIYTALRALEHDPSLWERYKPDDSILFRQGDLQNPGDSELFSELLSCSDPAIRTLAGAVRDSLQSGAVPPPLSRLNGIAAVITSTANAAGWWKQPDTRHNKPQVQRSAPLVEEPNPLGAGWVRILKETGASDFSDYTSLPIWVKKKEAAGAAKSVGQVQFVASLWRAVFHLPACQWAKKIEPHNLVGFATLAEAEAWDYVPCKACRPLQLRIGTPNATVLAKTQPTAPVPASPIKPTRWDPNKVQAFIQSPVASPGNQPKPVTSLATYVELGATVKLRYDNGKLDIVRLVRAGTLEWGSCEVADNTPLGDAIKGARVGETVRYLQLGSHREAVILEIL